MFGFGAGSTCPVLSWSCAQPSAPSEASKGGQQARSRVPCPSLGIQYPPRLEPLTHQLAFNPFEHVERLLLAGDVVGRLRWGRSRVSTLARERAMRRDAGGLQPQSGCRQLERRQIGWRSFGRVMRPSTYTMLAGATTSAR